MTFCFLGKHDNMRDIEIMDLCHRSVINEMVFIKLTTNNDVVFFSSTVVFNLYLRYMYKEPAYEKQVNHLLFFSKFYFFLEE